MSPSFFEKIAGITNEEEAETPQKVEKKTKKKEENIKKQSLIMPKAKKIQDETNETKEVETFTDDNEPVKEKSWLEEAETEEGQLTIDEYQTDQDIIIKSTIAGVKPEDIDISINNDMVTIRGKRTNDEQINAENYYYQELYWGTFSRSIILPVEVDPDKTKATIKNGILTIKLPKSEKTKIKKINVIRNEE
ncbi:MAG: Hsp20/alpha crystallin family protein [bacterium]|nr:Hsp20/alpha crystallin family protein [bacterium]